MNKKLKIRIGSLKLKNKIFLAPMHQINDIAFRLLCKKSGAALTYTGLLNPQTREKLYFQDKPCVQFACNRAKGIKEFIKKYDKKISMYDFNLGCPSPHAKQSKIGYFMTGEYEVIEQVLKEIKNHTKKPLTIKIRKMPMENTKKIITLAEKYCDAIGVHPRTQIQGYSGLPDLEFAKEVKKLTPLPLIYSGNINNKAQAEEALKEFNFIMIGRVAMGNPGIFSEILGKKIKRKINFFDWLKLSKKTNRNTYFSQIKFQALNFTKGFPNCSEIRQKIALAKTEEEIINILKEIKN
jgi:tRNA-dihydrouridine synthase